MKFKLRDTSKWHKVFALLPVYAVDGYYYWLEYVYRRRDTVAWVAHYVYKKN